MNIWLQFAICAGVILYAGSQLSRHGDVIAEKTGLGGNWVDFAGNSDILARANYWCLSGLELSAVYLTTIAPLQVRESIPHQCLLVLIERFPLSARSRGQQGSLQPIHISLERFRRTQYSIEPSLDYMSLSFEELDTDSVHSSWHHPILPCSV